MAIHKLGFSDPNLTKSDSVNFKFDLKFARLVKFTKIGSGIVDKTNLKIPAPEMAKSQSIIAQITSNISDLENDKSQTKYFPDPEMPI